MQRNKDVLKGFHAKDTKKTKKLRIFCCAENRCCSQKTRKKKPPEGDFPETDRQPFTVFRQPTSTSALLCEKLFARTTVFRQPRIPLRHFAKNSLQGLPFTVNRIPLRHFAKNFLQGLPFSVYRQPSTSALLCEKLFARTTVYRLPSTAKNPFIL